MRCFTILCQRQHMFILYCSTTIFCFVFQQMFREYRSSFANSHPNDSQKNGIVHCLPCFTKTKIAPWMIISIREMIVYVWKKLPRYAFSVFFFLYFKDEKVKKFQSPALLPDYNSGRQNLDCIHIETIYRLVLQRFHLSEMEFGPNENRCIW